MMPLDLAIDVLKCQKVKLIKGKIFNRKDALLVEFPDTNSNNLIASISISPKEECSNPIGHMVVKVNPDYMYTSMYYDFIKGVDAIRAIRDVVDNRFLYENFSAILK